MKLAAIFLALSMGTAQADEPRYDNTSIETLKASAQEVMASMDPEGKAALSRVIGKLMMDTLPKTPSGAPDFTVARPPPEVMLAKIGPILDGHTGAEMIGK